jgi:hypothetical protein
MLRLEELGSPFASKREADSEEITSVLMSPVANHAGKFAIGILNYDWSVNRKGPFGGYTRAGRGNVFQMDCLAGSARGTITPGQLYEGRAQRSRFRTFLDGVGSF